MVKRYIMVFVIVLLAMAVWWHEALRQMIVNQSGADAVLFLIMALSSSLIGFLSVCLLLKALGATNNAMLQVLLSSVISLLALWALSLKLIEIMTIT